MDGTREAARVRQAELLADLLEAAERIVRENLRRRHPEAGREEIARRLSDWYMSHDEEDADFAPPLRVIPPPAP